MIPDSLTNFLYLADCLPKMYPAFYKRFENVLKESNINFSFLPNTKDVWAVDYMPIQTELKDFVHFTYQPSYLKSKKELQTISDVDSICKVIGLSPLKTDIILDGGNVVRSAQKAIITERVFIDNPKIKRNKLIGRLQELLQIDKLYFIPEQPDDFTGHSDGMVRFIDENTVIINDFSNEKKSFTKAFKSAIANTGLNYITIPYSLEQNDNNVQANGDYINYLQMENIILIPTFNIDEDDAAVKKLEEIFTGHTVKTINSNDIADEGGVLNCISWNIIK